MQGTGAGNTPWETTGMMECDWNQCQHTAMMLSFQLLTDGKAQYGSPGPCGGPYLIKRLVIQLEDDPDDIRLDLVP
jgi:hypothetical protein